MSGGSVARLKRTVRLGVKSLWLHRLRSLLTVLGIVFGVCSVIAMLAVGEGASYEAQEQIRSLGSNNIIVRSVKPASEMRSGMGRSSMLLNYGLTYVDVKIIQNTIPAVTVVAPARIIRDYVWNKHRKVDCEIVGTVTAYPEMRNHGVQRGRYFTEMEMAQELNVCLLGEEMVDTLFPIGDPVGKTVRVGSDYYRVIGIMSAQGQRVDLGKSTNQPDKATGKVNSAADRMYIPLTAASGRFGETLIKRRQGSFEAERVELHELTIRVANQDDVIESAQIVGEILERTHKKDDYDIVVPLELLRQAERTKQIFNIVLGAIAAISLLVGGIGIMNIMLASVTERTREIGIRRALGAKKRDIIVQFLVETVMLSGAGGLIGVALGIAIPFLITFFTGMMTVVTFWSPPIAFSISGLVGVIFGIYPALRAANMDPVEALRHE